MDEPTAAELRALVQAQPVAALGTLHATRDGVEPFVSMVPVAWLPGPQAVIHVSALAPHTRDLAQNPRVSLMLTAEPGLDAVEGTHATVQGDEVEVTMDGETMMVNDSNISCGGIKTGNATVYLIDSVLLPPTE